MVKPVTSHDVAGAVTVHVSPVFAVTKYDVAAPPTPATGVTVTFESPATTVGAPGVPGTAEARYRAYVVPADKAGLRDEVSSTP